MKRLFLCSVALFIPFTPVFGQDLRSSPTLQSSVGNGPRPAYNSVDRSGEADVFNISPADNLGNHIATQNIDVNGFTIINVPNPANPDEVANKIYVDNRAAAAMDNLGNHNAEQALDMNTYRIIRMGDANLAQDGDGVNVRTLREYVEDNGDHLGNHTATQDLDMKSFTIVNLQTPINDQDAVNKFYVDTKLGALVDNDTTYIAGTGLALNGNTFSFNTTWGDARYVLRSLQINTSDGIIGGGNLSATRTLSLDNTVVRTSNNQSIGGVKTFSNRPVLNAGLLVNGGSTLNGGAVIAGGLSVNNSRITLVQTPIEITDAANKGYVDGQIAALVDSDTTYTAGSGLTLTGTVFSVNSSVVRTTNNQSIAGVKTFASAPIFNGGITVNGTASVTGSLTMNGGVINLVGSPVQGTDAANKDYVDARFGAVVDNDTTYLAGDGLNLNGVTFSVNNSVVRTSGNQTIAGSKTFANTISGSITGNAGTATALATARTINGVSFNGTANITLPTVNTAGTQTIGGAKTFSSAVIVGAPTVGGHATTKSYVDGLIAAIPADTDTTYTSGDGLALTGTVFSVDATVLRTAGDQAIAGVKTFADTIVGSISGNAATATRLATARTINGVSFNGTANITLPTVNTSGNQTIAGAKTFSSAVVVGAPTAGGHATTKTYVDGLIAAIPADTNTTYTAGDGLNLTGTVFSVAANVVRTTGNQTIAGTKTFSAPIAGSITGNAATATRFATARSINGVSFNGTANITLPTVNTAGNQTVGGTKTFSSPLVVVNSFDTDGTEPGAQRNGLYLADLGTTSGATLNPTGTAAIMGQISNIRSIGVSVDSAGNIWGFRTHSSDGTYTWRSKVQLADRATALANARTINGVSFNGTANITLPTVNTAGNQTIGGAKTFSSAVTVGAPTAGGHATTKTYVDNLIAALPADTDTTYTAGDGLNLTGTVFSVASNVVRTTGAQTIAGTKTFSSTISGSITGNAGTATRLATARTINGVSFNGAANITLPTVNTAGNQVIGGVKTFHDPIDGAIAAKDVRTFAANTGSAQNYMPSPSALPIKGMSALFSEGFTGNGWRSAMVMRGWGNGYTAWALSGPSATTSDDRWFLRSGNDDTWGQDYEIVHSGNVADLGRIYTGNNGVTVSGTAISADATVVRTTGNQTLAGVKTFSSTITGSISGNAGTASALATARTINGVSFNGTANITLPTVNTSGNQTIGGAKTFSSAITVGAPTAGGHAATKTYVDSLIAGVPADTNTTYTAGDGLSLTGTVFSVAANVVRTTGNQTIAGTKTFSAPIAGSITGNAGTATVLATARTINGVSFNGGANITLPTVNTSGNQTIAGVKTFSSTITGSISGNAGTATALATARTINGVAFNGTTNITLPTVNTAGNQTIAGAKTFSSPLTVVNSFNVNGTAPGGQRNGLYVADLGGTSGTTLNPTATAAIMAQISTIRSIGLSVDGAGNIWGFRTHTNDGTYTWQSKVQLSDRATALATARTINGVSFNGTANITLPTVNTSGNQTIAGAKTFSSAITVGAPTAGGHATTKTYVDGLIAAIPANTDTTYTAGDGLSLTGTVFSVAANVVRTTGNQTIAGTKTFSAPIAGSITGNAGTATVLATARTINGVSFNGGANITLPTVNTSGNQTVAGVKTFSSTITGSISGNAGTATRLATARTINGVSFNGTANITLPTVNTAGNQTIAGTKTFSSPIQVQGTFNVNGSAGSDQPNGLYMADLGQTSGSTLNPAYTMAIMAQLNPARSIGVSVDGSGYLWGFRSHNGAGTYTWASKVQLADRATALANARTINGVSFNGTANITLPTVNTAGNQTIAGTKTFSSALNVATPTAAAHATTKAYVDGLIGAIPTATYTAGDGIVLTGTVFSVAANVVRTTGNQTIAGTKTFSAPIAGSITGNAGTATVLATARTINGVSFNGGANITLPTVNTSGNQTVAGVKTFSSTITGSISGNAGTATRLATARTINGVSFNGTANITLPTANLSGNQTINGVKTFTSAIDGALGVKDVRDLAANTGAAIGYVPASSAMADRGISALFSQGFTGSGWRSAMVVRGWTGNYATWALSGPSDTTSDNRWFLRSGVGTTWSPDYEVVHSGNVGTLGRIYSGSNGVTVSGTAITADATVVRTTGNQTLAGVKTFSSTISGSISGNAGTATALATARTINGVAFNGTANINLPTVNMSGNQTVAGVKTYSGEARFSAVGASANQIRLYNPGNAGTTGVGALFRMDGSNLYVMMTNAGAGVAGNFNALRPITIGGTTGHVTLGNGVTVNTMATMNGGLRVNGGSNTNGTFYAGTANPTGASRLNYSGHLYSTRFYSQMYLYFSDRNLKDNIEPISGSAGLDIVNKLQGVSYTWKSNGDGALGMIAQDVEKVIPTAVATSEEGIKSVDYIQMIAPLVSAVQELNTRAVEAEGRAERAEATVEALLGRLEALEAKVQ